MLIRSTNTFLFNAGLVGFIYLLENMGAMEDYHYIIKDNSLEVSKDFLLSQDLSEAYIKAHIKKFGEDTAYNRIIKDMNIIQEQTKKYIQKEDKETKKILDDKYKFILNNTGLVRNSYLSACEGLKDYDYNLDLKELCKEIKETKNYQEKADKISQIKNSLEQLQIRDAFLMKDIIYSRINAIWTNVSFLNKANAKKSIKEMHESYFIQPLKEFISSQPLKEKKTDFNCIECNVRLPKAKLASIGFLNSTVDDPSRKTSGFWNNTPDVFTCPFCTFIYSLAPLGFEILGENLIFINSNTSIKNLIAVNSAIKSKESEIRINENEKYQEILNHIAQQIMENKQVELTNVQVIIRKKSTATYQFNILAKDIIEVFQKSKKQFEKINKIRIKINNNRLNVYQKVLNNILNRRSQYNLMNQLLRISLNENTSTIYLFNVLQIQINQTGGKDMEKDMKRASWSFKEGRKLRYLIASDTKERDNKLKGFSYQLLNALQVNDHPKFCDLILRMYSGRGFAVPYVLLETFSSDEKFQYIGYAFVMGLKNEYSKENEEYKNEEALNNDN